MSSVHYWNDNRIFYKEASSLAKEYDVELHAIGDFLLKKENKVSIYGLPVLKRIFRPVNWVRLLWRTLTSKARVYHFHDPELIPLGLVLKIFGRKVIYDIHEDYYDAILHKQWIPGMARKPVATAFNFLEKSFSSFFDALIFAELTYKDSFQKVTALKEDILNYPVLTNRGGKIFSGCRDRVSLIYAGNISEIRGAVQMVESLSLLVKAGINAQLYLVGPVSPPPLRTRLEQMASEQGIQDRLIITGRVSPVEVHCYYEQADLGLALLHPVENNLKSLVTKLFEYMSVGLPIVASNFPRWETLLRDVGAGLTVNPLDSEAIARAIEQLVNNPQTCKVMAENGRIAYAERFNWSSEESKLLQLYDKVIAT